MDLFNILKELEQYKNSDRQAVLTRCIQERLNASLSSYYKELNKSLSYLQFRQDGAKVLRKINELEEM